MNGFTKLKLINEFDKVFSLNLCTDSTKLTTELDDEINILIEKRNIAKKEKNFVLADKIRDELLKKGIKLIDTRDGTKYEKI